MRRSLLATHRYLSASHPSVRLSEQTYIERSGFCLQVSESGKALLELLQASPSSDSNSSAKPDFTAATHGIMGVLHQVLQVRLRRAVFR